MFQLGPAACTLPSKREGVREKGERERERGRGRERERKGEGEGERRRVPVRCLGYDVILSLDSL